MKVRSVLGVTLAVVLLALAPGRAAACVCGGTSEDVYLDHADVAFVGVVALVEAPNFVSLVTGRRDPSLYTFAVEEPLKGDLGEFAVIRGDSSSSCAFYMEVGERWRIYAHHGDIFGNVSAGELWVWPCDANELLATGVPAPIPPGGVTPLLILGLGAVLVAGVLMRRRLSATEG